VIGASGVAFAAAVTVHLPLLERKQECNPGGVYQRGQAGLLPGIWHMDRRIDDRKRVAMRGEARGSLSATISVEISVRFANDRAEVRHTEYMEEP
jgi:hypothetical protein